MSKISQMMSPKNQGTKTLRGIQIPSAATIAGSNDQAARMIFMSSSVNEYVVDVRSPNRFINKKQRATGW